MSDSGREAQNVRDRRFQRTRGGLLDAFRDLIFSRGYDAITVGDIVERANVGRSTFYEHYENKDDLLRQSMAPIVAALAFALQSDSATDNLRWVVAHVRENRRFSTSVMTGEPRRLIVQFVADGIEERLSARHRAGTLPFALVAKTIAEAQIGLLIAWLAEDGYAAGERVAEALVAEALVASSRAIEAAMLPP